MCHVHHDPDAIIEAYTDKLVEGVLRNIMDNHGEDRIPAVIRLKEDGLVFQQLIVEDVFSDSLAGKRIAKELNSLGFVNIRFYDHGVDGYRTALEYTLTNLARYEELQNV